MTEPELPMQEPQAPPARKLKIFGREFPLPRSRLARIIIGVNLVFLGMLGFLPVLGFWMIPLGLLLLSVDIAIIRRMRRRMIIYYNGNRNSRRRRKRRGEID